MEVTTGAGAAATGGAATRAADAAMTRDWMTSTLPIISKIRSSCFLRRRSSEDQRSRPRSVDALTRSETCRYLTRRAKERATKKNEVPRRATSVTSTNCDFGVTLNVI